MCSYKRSRSSHETMKWARVSIWKVERIQGVYLVYCRAFALPVSSGQAWLTLCPLHPSVYIVTGGWSGITARHARPQLRHIYACVQEELNSWRSSYTCRIRSRRASRARWGQGSVAVFTTESWTEVITAATALSVTAPPPHPGMCNCARRSRRTIINIKFEA